MNLYLVFCSMERPNVSPSHLSLFMRFSYTIRVRNTAVKNEHTMPMIHVVAKPLIGPVPMVRRMIPVMREVRLESKMAENALL